MDWIASEFDVLNVIAGAESGFGELPTDNFNGITVAFTAKQNGFRRVAADNDNEDDDDADGGRVSVDLLAPGQGVELPISGGSTTTTDRGTSFAAPHVTGTVALLNEYSDYQTIVVNDPAWDLDNPRKHEVMKAVLLNSADKNVSNENGMRWTQTSAYSDDTVSLDQQMGAGFLNAGRALATFRSGQHNGVQALPKTGWDYGETGGIGTVFRYPFTAPSGFVTVTLAWDRGVFKTGAADTFTISDMFIGQELDDLDLFVAPVGSEDFLHEAVARSLSMEDNVEHIYKQIAAGSYEIVVYQANGGDRDYGLAWSVGSNITGDFDRDGNVGQSDLGAWKSSFNSSDGGDADFDGDSDGADLLAWQQNLGTTSPVVVATAPIPEPATGVLAALVFAATGTRRRR